MLKLSRFLSNNLLIAISGSRALAQSFAGKAPAKDRCWGGEYQEGLVKESVLSQQMVTKSTPGDSLSGAAYIIHHVMDSRAEIQSDCDGHNEPVLFSQVLSRVLQSR